LAVNSVPTAESYFLAYDDGNFTWASAGDITGVTAGSGLTGGGTSGDVTLSVSGDINVDTITTTGDINQDRTGHGVAKALIHIDSDGTCSTYWTFDDSVVSCVRVADGQVNIDFDFVVNDRFIIATPQSSISYMGYGYLADDSKIRTWTQNDEGTPTNVSSSVVIY
jgi:hypothetical protein